MSYLIILNYIYINFLIQKNNNKNINISLIAFSVFLTFFIAFRYEVGGDWFTYQINYDSIAEKNLFYSLKAYSSKLSVLIVYFTKNFKIFTEILVLGIIFSFFYIKYLISTKFFFLSAFITFPVFVILAGLGYVHQGVSIVVCWQVLINYQKKTSLEIIGYIVIASLIHLSALIFLFFLIPKIIKIKNLSNVLTENFLKFLPYFILLAVILLQFFNINPYDDLFESIVIKIYYYLMDDYYRSNGAIIRMLLFIPSIYILYKIDLDFFKKKNNSDLINLLKITGFVMLFTIFLSVLFIGSINYAFVDRIFISLIFFQVIISNIYYEQYKFKDNVIVDIFTYLFPLVYMFMWVNFSKYSKWWIPYNNIYIQ